MVDYVVFDSPKFRGVRLLADQTEVQPGTYSYSKIPDVLLKLTCGHTERYMRVLSDTLFVRLDAFHKLTLVPTFTESRKETLSALVILYKGVVLERLRGSWHVRVALTRSIRPSTGCGRPSDCASADIRWTSASRHS